MAYTWSWLFQYKKVCSSQEIPIGFTISYGMEVLKEGKW